jgi:hypothetical protein
VVTRYFSISARNSSGVHLSITTTGCPMCIEQAPNIKTAV